MSQVEQDSPECTVDLDRDILKSLPFRIKVVFVASNRDVCLSQGLHMEQSCDNVESLSRPSALITRATVICARYGLYYYGGCKARLTIIAFWWKATLIHFTSLLLGCCEEGVAED